MNVDGHIERLGALEDHPKLCFVQIMTLGVTINESAFETVTFDRSFELLCGR